MLIDPNANQLNQCKQKQDYLKKLHRIKNIPVTESTKERDQLEQECLDYIYEKTFDSLFGGLIVEKNNLYYKPIITNLYLCELLVTAGCVFCQGEFLYVGKQILDNVINTLSECSERSVKSENYFEQKHLPCYFNKNKIIVLLDEKESQLLFALTSSNKDPGILISYVCSLTEAAEKINMHYKQAQIIEFNFRKKLVSFGKKSKLFEAQKIEDDFNFNRLLLTSLKNIIGLVEVDFKQSVILKIQYLISKLEKSI